MNEVTLLSQKTGILAACDALAVPRASWYRAQKPASQRPKSTRSRPPRSLTDKEQRIVLDALNSEQYVDMAPYEVYAALLDEGCYLCSIRSMYRILEQADEVRERRNQRRHGAYQRPELLAEAPNQLWSWDITRLKGPTRGMFFYLYVMLDVFSRYVVGWLLGHEETGQLGKRLLEVSCQRQGIEPGQLVVHSDNGPQMRSKPVKGLVSNLGLEQSFSRPSISNDNPYSEAQFKTLKYRPAFPERFASWQDGASHCRQFFPWYNDEHYHTGLALLTPHAVHTGEWEAIVTKRQEVLDAAYEAHPERFVGGRPIAPKPPAQVWINPPLDSGDSSPSTGATLEVLQ